MKTMNHLATLIMKRYYDNKHLRQDRELTKAQVILHIESEMSLLIWLDLRTQLRDGGRGMPDPGWYTDFIDVPVTWDTVTNEAYSKLPYPVMALKDNKGIALIWPTKHRDQALVPIPSDWFGLMPNDYFMEGNRTWELRDNETVCYPNIPQSEMPEALSITMIASNWGSSNENEPLKMPSSFESPVIDRVLNRLGVRKGDDIRNDEKDKVI